jgi:hypothetical protein
VSNGLSARQPRPESRRCRPPSQRDRFPDGQVLCGIHPVDVENRRPGAKRGPPAFPISTIRPGPPPPNGEAPTPRELEGKIVPGNFREGTAGRARGSACGSTLRTRETTFWRTTAEPPQRVSKGWLAGYRRFSKGVAERRDADLSTTQTLTTGFSKHQPLGQAQLRIPLVPTALSGDTECLYDLSISIDYSALNPEHHAKVDQVRFGRPADLAIG